MSASTLARIFPVWKFPAGFFDFREFSSQNRIRVVQFCLINSGGLSRTPLRTVGCTYAGARILLFSSLSRRRKLRFFASLRKRLFCRPFASLTACKKAVPCCAPLRNANFLQLPLGNARKFKRFNKEFIFKFWFISPMTRAR